MTVPEGNQRGVVADARHNGSRRPLSSDTASSTETVTKSGVAEPAAPSGDPEPEQRQRHRDDDNGRYEQRVSRRLKLAGLAADRQGDDTEQLKEAGSPGVQRPGRVAARLLHVPPHPVAAGADGPGAKQQVVDQQVRDHQQPDPDRRQEHVRPRPGGGDALADDADERRDEQDGADAREDRQRRDVGLQRQPERRRQHPIRAPFERRTSARWASQRTVIVKSGVSELE